MTVSLSIMICLILILSPIEKDDTGVFEYPEKLFGVEMIQIDIQVDKDKWQSMLDNAVNEAYIACDVTVNGAKFSTIGIRPKGNSSLSMVAGSDSDRFSFKLQFDEYVGGQTCFGLDKFVLNNMQGDYTYMKEYISYYLMEYMGVDSPLFNFAHVTVNGEEWGLYLAIENYEESFVERNYNTLEGNLYSVKMVNERFSADERTLSDDGRQNERFMPPDKMSGFGGRGGGGNLVYTDNNSASYSTIFENAIFNTSKENDFQRVITALEKLSKGEELETYFNVDQILRYFAVHTTVVNTDSYISNMQQNYYLYEVNGKVTILPWDYNLAFGGFQADDASTVINFPIDTPVSGVTLEERPLLAKLLEVPEYKEKYHSYLKEVADYLNSQEFDMQIKALDEKIKDYVKNDATAFCTFEQYEKAIETLTQLCKLRAESILGQLSGTIPSTTEEQNTSADLIDAADMDLSAMGGHGGGKRNGMGQFPISEQLLELNDIEEKNDSHLTKAKQTSQGIPGDPHLRNQDMQRPDMQRMGINQSEKGWNYRGLIWLGLSGLVLIIGLLIAIMYKRK